MRFRILGPLEVWTDGEWQPITAEKWRSLLSCLLLRANQIVSMEVLVDELWGDAPPARAKNLISIYVLRLRRLLGDNDGRLLGYRSPGYILSLADGDLDGTRFDSLVTDGRRALDDGDPVRAAALLSAGLGLWRGPFLANVPPTPLISSYSQRATENRLGATELWAQAAVAGDRHDEVVTELRGLVGRYPLREGLWLVLMQALDGAGRRAEALETYGQARAAISDELGVDPGADLRQLYAELLAADAADDASPVRSKRRGGAAAALAPLSDPSGSSAATGHGPASGAPDSAEGEDGQDIPAGEVPGTISMGSYTEAAVATEPGIAAAAPVPPLDPATPPPTQLPADIGDFTGRELQVRHLCEMLTNGPAANSPGAVPIAFVAGAGGLGKTTLAIHAAHKVRDHFTDGQLYVDLLGATAQPARAGDVLARFLRDLGVDGDKVPAGDEERAALYRTRLTGRRVLIVLDSARDAAQVRPLLPGSASCAVLVTTRNRTADLASTRYVDLNVLDDDEALSLFARILGDERALAEPEATAQVVDACAGLPLAIRICAARLAARSHWPIATMARRLRDERRRLDEMRVGDLAVRASFQVSYDSLQLVPGALISPARLFRLLGLWQGPSISLRGVAVLVGASGPDTDAVEDALEGLVDAHLLESPEPGWYRFHDLLRVYATERANAEENEADRAVAQERLLRWYLHTADGAAHVVAPLRYHLPLEESSEVAPSRFTAREEALEWYDSERANIVSATRQAAQAGLHDIAWRLPPGLFPIFNRRDNWADVITTHRLAVESAITAGSRSGEGWTRNNLGFALARLRDPEALGHLNHALAIRHDLGDRAGAAQTAIALADARLKLSGPAEAIEPYQVAVAAAREAGSPSLLSVALSNLGETYLDLGQLEAAADCFRQVRDASANQSVYGQAYALHNLGRVYVELGRPEEAIASLHEALRLHEGAVDLNGKATTYRYLGRAYRAAGELTSARESWTAALAIFRQVGRQPEITEVEEALAALP